MPRRDSASRRLLKFIEYERASKDFTRSLAGGGWLGQKLKEQEERRQTDWSDPLRRAIDAHRALTFFQADRALKKAFEAFGLDPRNPFDWRKLIGYYSAAHYGSKGPGAPRKWTDDRMCQFLSDVMRVSELHPKADITKTCKFMKSEKSLSGRYRHIPVETLRKQLRSAIKWARSFRAAHRRRTISGH